MNERASGVAASRTGAFVLTNDGVLSYGLDGVFYGATVTEAKPLAMVNGRKLLLLEQGEVSVFEPPAPRGRHTSAHRAMANPYKTMRCL